MINDFHFSAIKFFIFTATFFAVWIIGDFLFSTFILQKGFVFTLSDDIIKPLVCALPCALIVQMAGKNRKKDHNEGRRDL